MSDLSLRIAVFDHGQWDGLRDGSVVPQGIALNHADVGSPYRPMVRDLAFDVAEIAFTTYVAARSFGIPITAIPIFSNRDVTMTPVLIDGRSGIQKPKDLEGKRIGLRSYTVTNNTQCRGLLSWAYGVDSSKVTWVVRDDAHVAQYKDPSNVEYAPDGASLEEMLVKGEIDGGIQLRTEPGATIRYLIDEEQGDEIGLRYYRETGMYPIGHVMTIKDSVLREYPWVARSMYDAFVLSKDRYVASLGKLEKPSRRDQQAIRNQSIVNGDPFPMGVENNRLSIQGMLDMYVEQAIISQPMSVESLFIEESLTY